MCHVVCCLAQVLVVRPHFVQQETEWYFQWALTSDDVEQYNMSSCSSSAASSPVEEAKYVPFQPAYSVSVSDPVKNGDILQYTVKTTQLSDDIEFTVTRQFEDFEYLHHCLHMQNPQDGIIVSVIWSFVISDVKTDFIHNWLSICWNRFFTDNRHVIII